MNQKVKQYRFLKLIWLLNTPKKFIPVQSDVVTPGSGSGPRCPDPVPDVRIRIRQKRSGSDLIRNTGF
jgi:hypothetical protein